MNPFQYLHQPTGRIIRKDEKDYLFFGGTAYLGLLTNKDYIALYKEGIDRYGLNNGTSRSNNVQLGVFDDAELQMATRFDFQDAILVSSGYLAAQLAIRMLKDKGELIYAPATHPALWLDDAPQVKLSFKDWALNTVERINSATENSFVVISNTLDNLTPEYYDFSVFEKIKSTKKVYLLLDDSHGLGIREENSCFVDLANLRKNKSLELIVVASLAKGMGTDAGIILSSKVMTDFFRRSNFFRGASPCSPAALFALIMGEDIYKRQFAKLQKNIAYMHSRVGVNVKYLDRFPVFTVARKTAFLELQKQQILISSFPYPLLEDPLVNRIVISSHHEQEDLDTLLSVLKEWD